MKVLILGGNRFVGKRLTQILVDRKFHVDLLNRGSVPAPLGVSRQFVADRSDSKKLAASVEGQHWDLIIDFSCYTGEEAGNACVIFEEKTDRYIHISTVSVYRAGKNLDERAGGPSPNDYGRKKFQAEIEFSENAAWPIAMIRFPIILGPDDYTKRLLFHVERVKKQLPIYFPNLDAQMSFVHSADAARFLNFLIDHPAEGPINCASPDPVKLRTLMTWIEEATGMKAKLLLETTDAIYSPYGIEEDWWINTSKMQSLGFSLPPCTDWIPQLVKEINTRIE